MTTRVPGSMKAAATEPISAWAPWAGITISDGTPSHACHRVAEVGERAAPGSGSAFCSSAAAASSAACGGPNRSSFQFSGSSSSSPCSCFSSSRLGPGS